MSWPMARARQAAIAQAATAQAADTAQAEQAKQGLQKPEGSEEIQAPDEDPDDPDVQKKVQYTTEHLNKHQEELSEHLQELIDGYPTGGTAKEQSGVAIAFEATLDYCIKNDKSDPPVILYQFAIETLQIGKHYFFV